MDQRGRNHSPRNLNHQAASSDHCLPEDLILTIVEMRSKPIESPYEAGESARPRTIRAVFSLTGVALVVFVVLFSGFSNPRNSRMRCRRRILFFRSRPNLALSPFLSDTIPSLCEPNTYVHLAANFGWGSIQQAVYRAQSRP
jgi:hypothetical protein